MGRFILAIITAKLIYFLTRTLKTGGGSAAPGLYALKIDPGLISKLSSQIPQNIVITGTNGKTTTARLLTHLAKTQNIKVIRNSTGSNLERGLASALLERVNLFGQIKYVDLGIWELDEAAFNKSVFQLKPQIIVFLNAFRDQLDRYGEVDNVVRKWKESLEKIDWDPIILINGNDVNTSKLYSENTQVFGVKGVKSFGEKGQGAPPNLNLDFAAKVLKNKGLSGTEIQIIFSNGTLDLNLRLPGIYHVFDLLAAFGAAYNLNLAADHVAESLESFSPAFGRVEEIKLGENSGFIFLIKNPAGASLVLETISPEIKKEDRLLLALNDNFADGTDVSWIWDAGFEQLGNTKITMVCSGTRAYDLAVRLKYAGVNSKQLVIKPDLKEALGKVRERLEGRLFILPTYTALLQLQKILAEKKIKAHYWKDKS